MSCPKCKARNVAAVELDWWHHPPSHMDEFRKDIYWRICWRPPL